MAMKPNNHATPKPEDHARRVQSDEHFHWLDGVCQRIKKACVPDDIMRRDALHRIEAKAQVRHLMAKHKGDTRAACAELLRNLGTYEADENDRRAAEELAIKRMAVRDRFAVLAGRLPGEDWGVFAGRMTSTKHVEHAAGLCVEAGGAKRSGPQERKRMDMDERTALAEQTAAGWVGDRFDHKEAAAGTT